MVRSVWLGALVASMLVVGAAMAEGPTADGHVTRLRKVYVAGGRVIGERSRVESAVPFGGGAPRLSADLSHQGLREETGRSPGGGVIVDLRGRFGSALRLEVPFSGSATCETASMSGGERP